MVCADDRGRGVLQGYLGLCRRVVLCSDSATTLTFLTIILAGMSAGSIASLSSWPPAQYSYTVLTMMPIALRYLLEGGDLWSLGLMCPVLSGQCNLFSRQLSRALIVAARKQKLVQQLREEMSAGSGTSTRRRSRIWPVSFLPPPATICASPLQAMNLFYRSAAQ